MLTRKPTKEEKEALKIFLHKTPVFRTHKTVDKHGNEVYLGDDYQHRGWKALKIITPLFSHDDAYQLRDAIVHVDSIRSFYDAISRIYQENGINLRTFEVE